MKTVATTPPAASSLARGLLLGAFFLSGGTGLVYEVVWVRLLSRTTGGTGLAISLVLAMFMAGLALGGWLGAKWADRSKNPYAAAWIYGVLELAIGLYSCAFPVILACLEPLQAAIYRHYTHNVTAFSLCTFLVSGIVLLVPTTLMGATLPFLCRFCVSGFERVGVRIGLLYALNTAGAALGAGLAGFWMIRVLGVSGSLWAAATVNVLIGLACLSAPQVRHAWGAVREMCRARAGPLPDRLPGTGPVMAILAVSGFCAMTYEVIWTRLLSLLIGPTTYSFTLVLIAFITGLAVGSAVIGRLADRTTRAAAWLAGLQLTGALTALAASQLLGGAQFFFAKLIHAHQDHFARLQLWQGVIVFAFLFPTAFCMGGMFPLASRAVTASLSTVGRMAGRLYTCNTIGALLGAAVSGLVLVEHLGKERSLALVIGAQALSAAVFIVTAGLRPVLLKAALLLPALAVLALLCGGWPRWNHLFLSDGKYHRFSHLAEDLASTGYAAALWRGNEHLARHDSGNRLLYSGDGPAGFCSVIESINYLGSTNLMLSISGKVDASSRIDQSTQVLSAHLPMLMHPGPKSVMVLGLASGMTAGEILRYPVERLDVLEISRQVVEASRFFGEFNHGVLSDPRTELLVQDGRLHMRFTDRQYDVISSEPSNPWIAGLAVLYTREYFQDVRAHLKPGGIFVQFMHAYQMDWPTFALVGRTILSVFPEAHLMQTGLGSSDLLFICPRDKASINESVWSQNLPYASRSPFIRIPSCKVLYPLFLAANLKELFGSGPVNTDDHPVLEYQAPFALYDGGDAVIRQLQASGQPPRPVATALQAQEISIGRRLDLMEFLSSINAWPYGLVQPDALDAEEMVRYRAAADAYAGQNSMTTFQGLFPAERPFCLEVQSARTRAWYEQLQRTSPGSPLKLTVLNNLARLQWAAGRRNEAIKALEEARALDPSDIRIRFSLAVALDMHFQERRAGELFDSLLREDAVTPGMLTHMSGRYLRLRQPDCAEPLIRRILAKQPATDTTNLLLSELLRQRNDRAGAMRLIDAVITRSPRSIPAQECKLQLLMESGAYAEARRVLAQALPLDPDNRIFLAINKQLNGKR